MSRCFLIRSRPTAAEYGVRPLFEPLLGAEMDRYRFTVAIGEESHKCNYSTEEMNFLCGSGVPELIMFRRQVGLWDNFRVATGMDTQAWTVKVRESLLSSTLALLQRMEAEKELFALTYKLQCPGSLSRSASKCWVQFNETKAGHLLARHPGQLYFQWRNDPMADHEIYDLRAQALREGAVCGARVFTKPNTIRWQSFLSSLSVFLQECDGPEARIRHDGVPKSAV